nr:nitrate reductase 1, gamma subunit [uncultured Gammaproteobacteria bacterium]BAL55729.1 nitrate reductase 1, gamma subunit [uncultured Gammaproteobacteria bacterium]
MTFSHFLFGVYPFIAGTVFLLGSLIRYDREQYTFKADSSQLLEKEKLMRGSRLFHAGVILLFFGHLIGLLTPRPVFLALGVSDLAHQHLAIALGALFGTLGMIGGVILWRRRMFHPRIRAISRFMDIFILDWLLLTLALGLFTIPFSLYHAVSGDATIMVNLAAWAQSIVTWSPRPELLDSVPLAYKLHLFFGLTVFLLFPFTRLVHVLVIPLNYLTRPYQVVRAKFVFYRR